MVIYLILVWIAVPGKLKIIISKSNVLKKKKKKKKSIVSSVSVTVRFGCLKVSDMINISVPSSPSQFVEITVWVLAMHRFI